MPTLPARVAPVAPVQQFGPENTENSALLAITRSHHYRRSDRATPRSARTGQASSPKPARSRPSGRDMLRALHPWMDGRPDEPERCHVESVSYTHLTLPTIYSV